ncbi:V-type ATP synthase subunit D [Ignicoccus hospitalis]|uniref:A-type ATP synthase subunit D n=1 Tax=Ignicoccus hospitalis (strain KIN4/I / DSM 18386 / JCM 14125) TaxID=453591 RepID=A8AAB0_IGNH4|nr:V-type ATP synthase subunit D [Ignicoccus hospitalis]ABU81862.1 V-type ATPase, D subunit [Ignicoccus hospitalis KIN4/I]HIH90130.1 V-type ATP synthase subunit D [Desulfurococcaceae archaeon]
MSFPGSRRVLPTKINLIRLKQRKKVVERIRKLLEDKRDILLMYLRKAVADYQKYYDAYSEHLERAYSYLIMAEVQSGESALKQEVAYVPEDLTAKIYARTAFGVKIPVVEFARTEVKGGAISNLYSSPYLDKAAKEFEEAMKYLNKAINSEMSIYRIMNELRRTQRLINAVKYSILPEIENNIKFIKRSLDDQQREEFVRLKLIRSKLQSRRVA